MVVAVASWHPKVPSAGKVLRLQVSLVASKEGDCAGAGCGVSQAHLPAGAGGRGGKDSQADPCLCSCRLILAKTKLPSLAGLGCFCKLMLLINLPSVWCPAPGLPLHHSSLYSNF